eukprot:4228550-Pleurochrysis_carterae.AAC.1
MCVRVPAAACVCVCLLLHVRRQRGEAVGDIGANDVHARVLRAYRFAELGHARMPACIAQAVQQHRRHVCAGSGGGSGGGRSGGGGGSGVGYGCCGGERVRNGTRRFTDDHGCGVEDVINVG